MIDWEKSEHLFQYFQQQQVRPGQMDVLWADGWRHFGQYFFRDVFNYKADGGWLQVTPLRINLQKFQFSKHHKKLLKKTQETKVIFRPALIGEQKETMFYKHIQRFKSNLPESIYTFLDPTNPAEIPCPLMECCLYDECGVLYAVSFLDVGEQATSSVYAMFDPAYSDRSPGLHTLLEEIKFSQMHEKSYLYTGYAYQEPSHYDYKKQFKGTEVYDWQGNWQDLAP
jgi:arginine-tRNA-protein transferase